MNIEKEKEYLKESGVTGIHSESVGDYTLPDYNTDIGRILLIKARPVPSAQGFIDGENLEFSGVVEYDVVYLDSENNLTSCSFTTDYDLAVRCAGENTVGNDIRTALTGASIRLTGPRRLSARAQLISDIHMTELDSMSIEGDAITDPCAEIKTADAKIAYSIYSEPQEREYAEELARLDGVIADEITLLASDCVVKVEDTEVTEGSCAVSGSIEVLALVRPEGECAQCYKKEIPFEMKLELEGLTDGKAVMPTVTVASSKVSVSPTEDGVLLSCAVILESRLRATSNSLHTIPTDGYNRHRGTLNEYEDFGYLEYITSAKQGFSLSSNLPASEVGCSDMRNVVFLTASPRLGEATVRDGMVKISGDVRISGIACEINEDGELSYCGIKYDMPFEENVKLGCQIPEDCKVECALCATSVLGECDMGNLGLAVKLNASLTVLGRRKMRRLQALTLTEEVYKKEENVITVYYPEKGETLFDIAKRFHSSPLEIAADNSLTEEVFSEEGEGGRGFKKLIIR